MYHSDVSKISLNDLIKMYETLLARLKIKDGGAAHKRLRFLKEKKRLQLFDTQRRFYNATVNNNR